MTSHDTPGDNKPAPVGAIFNQSPVCVVDSKMIETLKAEALRSTLGRYRLCMHHSTDDPMQDMIVVHRRGSYSRPHSHPAAASSYTLIDGRMAVLIFDESGAVTQRIRMGCHGDPEADTVSLHLSAGTIYSSVCLTETVVFQETIAAPNPNNAATRYAEWSPAPDETERVAAFQRELHLAE